ncbi:MAG: ABC transporter permease [Spirochaetaceae bacterium]|jgi:simple sugar transport system permease protein|nr:ABC transporter permease [Spirochaetaceae bacterium]
MADKKADSLLRPKRDEDKNVVRLFFVFAGVFILMGFLKPALFLQKGNFISMATQFPEYGIMAIGVSLTMISGGIDLAVVGTANLSAIFAAKYLIAMAPRGAPVETVAFSIVIAVLLALVVGIAAGAFNGFLIARLRIPAILATLGTQQLFTGFAIVMTEGRPLSRLPILYSQIGNTELFGLLPVPFILYVLAAVAIGAVLGRTSFGLKLYLVGTNPRAAIYAGLENTRILMGTYMLSGLLSSIAGLIMMARANSAKADYGATYTLQCVLIAVLGGVDPNGGFGTIRGVTLAVFILQFLSSGLNMFEHISNFYRDVIWGGVLILALIFNWIIVRRNEKRSMLHTN